MTSALPTAIIPGPLMLKKGFAASTFAPDSDSDDADDQRGAASAVREANARGIAEDEEDDDGVPPVQVVMRRAPEDDGEEDDGLTQAQRDQARKRRGKRQPGDDDAVAHRQRVDAFNSKLAKLTDINEMCVIVLWLSVCAQPPSH